MLEEMAEEEYIYGPTNIKLPNPGMKKGGMVKKCKMDGIALRGKTRAKERSK